MFLKIRRRRRVPNPLYVILHISHTYVPPLSPVGSLGLVGNGVVDFDMSYMYMHMTVYMLLK
jgi:hypothetical protein